MPADAPAITWLVQIHTVAGPRDALADYYDDDDWLDLSDRVLSVDYKRGRDDRTARYEPGIATVLFDNSDGQLNPFTVGSLCELAADKMLPLSPIRIAASYDGGDAVPMFFGYLGPECWVVERSRFDQSTSMVQAVERSGWWSQVGLPSSPFAALVSTMEPDWWIRGLNGGVISGNGGLLTDWSGNNYEGRIEASGGAAFFEAPSLVEGDSDSAMRITASAAGVTEESALTSASTETSMACIWKGTASASDQDIIRQRRSAGQFRWQVRCTNAGQIVLTAYNTSGVATSYIACPDNLNSDDGRWDDGEPHLIVVRITGGDSMRIYVDGRTDTATSGVPASMDGRIIFGNGPQTADIDEVMFWRRVVTLGEMTALRGAFVGLGIWADDTMSERIEHLFAVGGVGFGVDDGLGLAPPDDDPGMAALTSIPANLGEAIEQVAESYDGVAWVDRTGYLRVRSQATYTTESISALFGSPLVNLTDETSPAGSPLPVRRSQPEWSGVRLDRVVNVSQVTVGELAFSVRNDASIGKYGVRRREWDSGLADALYAVELARNDSQIQADPLAELRAVTIHPATDANAVEYLVDLFELETLATLTWTPPGASALEVDCLVLGCEVQAEGPNVEATLALAPMRDAVVADTPT